MSTNGQTQPEPGLRQCEITGLWFPEEDVVSILGHVVSAEGKPVLLDKLRRGESIGNELERSSVGQRFGAGFVDSLIYRAITAFFAVIFLARGTSVSTGFMLDGIAYILFIAYLCAMHAIKGQTFGKMAAKIKVVRTDGKPMTLKTAAIRAFAFIGIPLVGMVVMGMGLMVAGAIISGVGVLANIVSAIMALADGAQQRALHDRIAGTRVVRVVK